MKDKKTVYILIPVVLLIWGIIFYRIYGFFNGGNNQAFHTPQLVITDSAELLNDSFNIHADYRDPFLDKAIKKQISGSGTTVAKPVKPVPTSSPWPAIVYGGIIKNQKSNKQLALIQINGQSNMMKAGEEANGVQLLKVFKDSIEVKFGKEKKYISK